MFCSKCGKNNPDNAAKCKFCGSDMPAVNVCGGFGDILKYENDDYVPEKPKAPEVKKSKAPAIFSVIAVLFGIIAILLSVMSIMLGLDNRDNIELLASDVEEISTMTPTQVIIEIMPTEATEEPTQAMTDWVMEESTAAVYEAVFVSE